MDQDLSSSPANNVGNHTIGDCDACCRSHNKLLKMYPAIRTCFYRRIRPLQTEIKATKEKLDMLKEAAKQVD